VQSDRDLWRAVRWPLLVLAIAGLGIGVATALDRTAAREWALTIGGPALTVLLPVGLVWLAVAVIVYVVKRRGGRPTSPRSQPTGGRDLPHPRCRTTRRAGGDDVPGGRRS
jgi:hypothetical protein